MNLFQSQKLDLEAEKSLREWAFKDREEEEAAFEFEERAEIPHMNPSKSEWDWLRMDQEVDPNELVHDRYMDFRECFK